MHEVRFSINITLQRYLEILHSPVFGVIVKSHNGVRIQFPAKYLKNFVTKSGIQGNFRIVYSAKNKFVRMEKV
ncbi:MAG: DUF2835 family protein [Pseudomonadota bacterium]